MGENGVGAFPMVTSEQRKDASAPKFSPSVGSFNGAAGAYGGITVEKSLVPEEKFRILPSMGTFNGGISKFGGILVLQEAAESALTEKRKEAPPSSSSKFSPSVG